MPVIVISECGLLVLLSKDFVLALPCPAEEGSNGAGVVGTWHPANVNPPLSHSKKPLVINTATKMALGYNPMRLTRSYGGLKRRQKHSTGRAALHPSCAANSSRLPVPPMAPPAQDTHGSKTKRVMYSFGIRGSWWENTFCRPTSHIMIFLLGFWFRELPTTWNSITPLRSSSRAASSRAECADRKLVCATQTRSKITVWGFHVL